MASATASIDISAPPEVVFDFVADAPRIPEYVRFVHDVFEVSEGPIGVGTRIKEHAKPGPFNTITEWEIIDFDRPRRQVWDGHQSDMDMTLTKTIEPTGGGCRYTQVMHYRYLPRLRPVGWLLEKLVVDRTMRTAFEQITAGIKDIVEREHAEAQT